MTLQAKMAELREKGCDPLTVARFCLTWQEMRRCSTAAVAAPMRQKRKALAASTAARERMAQLVDELHSCGATDADLSRLAYLASQAMEGEDQDVHDVVR